LLLWFIQIDLRVVMLSDVMLIVVLFIVMAP
jgi:hypothetical protein